VCGDNIGNRSSVSLVKVSDSTTDISVAIKLPSVHKTVKGPKASLNTKHHINNDGKKAGKGDNIIWCLFIETRYILHFSVKAQSLAQVCNQHLTHYLLGFSTVTTSKPVS